MNTIECIKTRRSIRKFEDRPVPRELMTEIISAAAFAPSWKNTRTPRYTVIDDKAVIAKIAAEGVLGNAHNAGIINGTNCFIIQSAVNSLAGYEPDGSYSTVKGDGYTMYDAGIAAQTLCLAAHEKGLGTVIMGIIDYDRIAEIISLPENETVVAAIAIGYPAQSPSAPKKFTADEILRFI
ncbi:MAG: nitroreductase family protein [Oscillospiraceae bacterium]|nr:nitroreductase family protein [Oscillospiraceae bacterium]